MGTPKKDKVYVAEATGFHAGSGNDELTSGSFPVYGEDFPCGYLVNPVVMPGGAGKDTYKFETDMFEWGFTADAGGGKDIVKFSEGSPFNPCCYSELTRVDTVLINNRDVLVISTDLEDGGRSNGVIFRTHSEDWTMPIK